MADERIKISIEIEDLNIKETFQSVEVSAKNTAIEIDKAFSDSLDSINSKNVELLNQNLENLNKTLMDTTTIQDTVASDVERSVTLFAGLANIFSFVSDNTDVLLFLFAKLSKRSESLADVTKDTVESFGDLRREFNEANVETFMDNISQLGKQIGVALVFIDPKRVYELLKAFGLLDAIAGKIAANFAHLAAGVTIFGASVFTVIKASKDLVKVGLGVGGVLFSNTKNVFGLTTALSAASIGLLGFSKAFERSNNEVLRISSVVAGFAAILLGGFAAGLTFAIVKLGQFAYELGTNLVNKFKAASNSFVEADRSLKIFTATVIAFNRINQGAIASTEEWTQDVKDLSGAFNLSSTSLRKAGAEIVAVGTRIGLTTDQQRELLKVTAEYAKITGKDVFDASVSFVSGLNGQSQALLSYGVKLTEASNKQFLLKKGITENFRTLTDSEKVQTRYNNLISQYSAVAGLGGIAAGTLADQQNRLKVEIENVNTKIGEGAALIEANNSVAFLLNKTLGTLSDGVFKAFGFFGAFGSRLIQISGLLITFSFKLFAVTKGIKLLGVLLKSDLLQTAFARSIPLIGVSFNQLVKDIAGSNASLKKTADIIPLLASVVATQVKNIPIIIGGAMKNLGAIMIPLLPIIAKVAVVLAVLVFAGKAVASAFEELEEQSGAVSTITGILNEVFAGTKSVLQDVLKIFSPFIDGLKQIFNVIVGGIVFALSKLIQLGNSLVQSNPFGVFSEETRKKFAALNKDLEEVNENLLAVNFNIGLLGETSFSSASKAAENLGKLRDKLSQVKNQIAEILAQSSEAQLEKLQTDFNKRNEIIDESLRKGLLSQEMFNKLKLENEAAYLQATSGMQSALQKTVGSATDGIVSSIGVITEAFAQGENGFEAFRKAVLGIFGDMLIKIGTGILIGSKAIIAFKESLTTLFGGFGIAGGLALIAIGGALKGSAGNIASSSGQAATDSVTGGGIGSDTLEQNEVSQSPNTVVNVNVEGSILSDNRQAGLEITNVLKEFFDTSGGGGVVIA